MLGWSKVQADDVLDLLDEAWVVGKIEDFMPMLLQAMGAPDARHCGGVGSEMLGQRAGTPVSRARGRLLDRDTHHLSDVRGVAGDRKSVV